MKKKESQNIFLEDAVKYIEYDIFQKNSDELAELIRQDSVKKECTQLKQDQVELRKKYFDSMPNQKRCLELAKEYADETGLYAIRFGEPFFSGSCMYPDYDICVNALPSVIEMPFYITDGKHTLEENIYIEIAGYNGQNREDIMHVEWNKVIWKARGSFDDLRTLRAKFEKSKRGYVLVEVEDVEQAKELAKRLYETDDVTAAHVWNRERVKSLNSHLAMSQMRAGRTSIPDSITSQIKPRENRLNFLEDKTSYYPDEIDNEWFLDKNTEKLSENYKNKFIVLQDSHVLSAGKTEKAAVRKAAELDPNKSYLVVNFTENKAEYSLHRPKEE